jgi:hypothetical protein
MLNEKLLQLVGDTDKFLDLDEAIIEKVANEN